MTRPILAAGGAALIAALAAAALAACPGADRGSPRAPLPPVRGLGAFAGLAPHSAVALGGGSGDYATATGVAWSGDAVIAAGVFDGALSVGGRSAGGADGADGFVASLDPKAGWTKTLTGPGADAITAIAAAADAIVVAASVSGRARFAGRALIARGQPDAAVIGLDRGGHPRWTLALPSTRYAHVAAIAIDDDGRIAIAGRFGGTVRIGDHALTSAGRIDGFAAALDPDGAVRWARRFGGTGADAALAVAIRGEDIAIAGAFMAGAELAGRPLSGASEPGTQDAFAAMLGPGGAPRWIWTLGSSGNDAAHGVALAADGGLVLVGVVEGPVFFATRVVDSRGGADGFALALTADGKPRWYTALGGPGDDDARALARVADGWIAVGTFEDDAEFGGIRARSAGAHDGYFAALTDAGEVAAVRQLGGAGHDEARAIATHARQLAIGGAFEGEATVGKSALRATGAQSAFVARWSW